MRTTLFVIKDFGFIRGPPKIEETQIQSPVSGVHVVARHSFNMSKWTDK